jgi:hypothetical protein
VQCHFDTSGTVHNFADGMMTIRCQLFSAAQLKMCRDVGMECSDSVLRNRPSSCDLLSL